ncbi:MAG: hypothetical protein ACI9SQ_001113, partial [Rubritalea sp.]
SLESFTGKQSLGRILDSKGSIKTSEKITPIDVFRLAYHPSFELSSTWQKFL